MVHFVVRMEEESMPQQTALAMPSQMTYGIISSSSKLLGPTNVVHLLKRQYLP